MQMARIPSVPLKLTSKYFQEMRKSMEILGIINEVRSLPHFSR